MSFATKATTTVKQPLKVINTDTLGAKEKVKKGSINFIPLFTTTKDGPGLTADYLLENGLYTWFKYSCRLPGDSPGKDKTASTTWIDTQLRAGTRNGTLNDPGVTLGLDSDTRKFIPGFGVKGLGFQDPKSMTTTIRVPIILGVTQNEDDDENCDPTSGELALFEMNASQFKKLVEAMKVYNKANVTYQSGKGDAAKPERYPYKGYGFVYNLNKDTSRGFDTYQWTKTDIVVSKSQWESKLEEAQKAFAEYKEGAEKYGRYYSHIIDDCVNGRIDFATAEKMVVAEIAAKVLSTIGITFEDSVDGILEAFDVNLPLISLVQGAGISQAGTNPQRVTMGDEEEPEPEKKLF